MPAKHAFHPPSPKLRNGKILQEIVTCLTICYSVSTSKTSNSNEDCKLSDEVDPPEVAEPYTKLLHSVRN